MKIEVRCTLASPRNGPSSFFQCPLFIYVMMEPYAILLTIHYKGNNLLDWQSGPTLQLISVVFVWMKFKETNKQKIH